MARNALARKQRRHGAGEIASHGACPGSTGARTASPGSTVPVPPLPAPPVPDPPDPDPPVPEPPVPVPLVPVPPVPLSEAETIEPTQPVSATSNGSDRAKEDGPTDLAFLILGGTQR